MLGNDSKFQRWLNVLQYALLGKLQIRRRRASSGTMTQNSSAALSAMWVFRQRQACYIRGQKFSVLVTSNLACGAARRIMFGGCQESEDAGATVFSNCIYSSLRGPIGKTAEMATSCNCGRIPRENGQKLDAPYADNYH